jgi:hypothetical protein
MYSLFGFGKKRRTRRKVSRKGRKGSRKGSRKMSAKPPSRLLKICKKYHVKATMKRGSKRVYKSIAVLKKACIKKVKAAMKAQKMHRRRGYSFGAPTMRRRRCGAMAFGKRGRRSGSRKVSKAAAMKAFRQFYKRHCAGGSRFGNGGNPPLSASMGYQFCPSGMGGVLGANSTGMFPSPCTSMNTSQAMAESNASMPAYSSSGVAKPTTNQLASYANQFGRRRYKSRKGTKSRKSRKGRKGRKSTRKGRKGSRKGRKIHRRRRTVMRRRRRGVTMRRRRRGVAEFGLIRRRRRV